MKDFFAIIGASTVIISIFLLLALAGLVWRAWWLYPAWAWYVRSAWCSTGFVLAFRRIDALNRGTHSRNRRYERGQTKGRLEQSRNNPYLAGRHVDAALVDEMNRVMDQGETERVQ